MTLVLNILARYRVVRNISTRGQHYRRTLLLLPTPTRYNTIFTHTFVHAHIWRFFFYNLESYTYWHVYNIKLFFTISTCKFSFFRFLSWYDTITLSFFLVAEINFSPWTSKHLAWAHRGEKSQFRKKVGSMYVVVIHIFVRVVI